MIQPRALYRKETGDFYLLFLIVQEQEHIQRNTEAINLNLIK